MKFQKQMLLVVALVGVFFAGIALLPGLHRLLAPVHAAVPTPAHDDVVVVTLECYYPQNQTAGPVVATATQSSNGSFTLPAGSADCTNGLQSLYAQGLRLQSFGVIEQTGQTFADTSSQSTSITTAYTTAQYLQWVLVSVHELL
jgi:hypothetical protein